MCIDQKQEKTLLHIISSYDRLMLYFMVHKGRLLCLWSVPNVAALLWYKCTRCVQLEKMTVGTEHEDMFRGCFVWACVCVFLFTASLTTTHTVSISISRLLHRCLKTPGTPLMPLMRTWISLVPLGAAWEGFLMVRGPCPDIGPLCTLDSRGTFSEENGRPSSLL